MLPFFCRMQRISSISFFNILEWGKKTIVGESPRKEGGIMKLYFCEKCGALYANVNEVGHCTPACCGQETEALKAGTTDAALEKHVPQVTREGNQIHVQVGSVLHPMTEEHWIDFIAVVQGKKVQYVSLTPQDEPKASFVVEDGPVEVYEHCNLHGLWKAEA